VELVSFTLVIDPLAEAELALARAEYDAIDPDLGGRFRAAVADVLAKIQATPLQFSLVTEGVHFYIPRRFPYVIYYRVEGDRVAVLAVVHKRQDQARWKRRR
jgi:plasmid stabilization system protein ParE